MKPQTKHPQNTAPATVEITPTHLFGAFAEERRQFTLSYLAQKPAAIHIGDLGEYIALKEDTPSFDWYQRILVDLHHRHLPYLCDFGLVRYDEETELVSLAIDRHVIDPYLKLAEQGE
ncbi:DUF7344 domain-containing protein [Natronosalvus vescus]|uniref:DUF7344 domain-containing protein n=1 Tax=Natronosalvus vescus TaxID=2953881 RepID=UPI002090B57A|nr:hypothetical protein [Natronosalvus vescus]